MTDQTPPPAAPAAAAPLSEADDRQWASFAHLGGILWIIPPLIIWLVFKDRGSFTNQEGKESLNFQITVTIAHIAIQIINAVLTAVTFGIWMLIGWILPLALWVLTIVFCIQGFTKAKDGIAYRYPFALRLIK
ncbi:DUF4870 domain-containing protein [Salinibacterium sp. SYSU T00001]|uniref:DUF4870 domain-containing protein n=1 Tax=Homoserinimonas sedimenticola TaxID=2986805 RepID=UPI0022369898|nr:DUF4870 domain-containing protein [Salinibacterium sedimenticola]MCW4384597.1 DUF4870 domain-containing protein [Salinibacterium sedimenticola]